MNKSERQKLNGIVGSSSSAVYTGIAFGATLSLFENLDIYWVFMIITAIACTMLAIKFLEKQTKNRSEGLRTMTMFSAVIATPLLSATTYAVLMAYVIWPLGIFKP